MYIKSASSVAEISFNLTEISKPERSHPSVAFSVETKNEDYFGRIRNVWFDKEDLQAFIKEAENLFSDENATATLKAYSDFWLKVKRVSASGHLIFHVHLENQVTGSCLELEVECDLSLIDSIKSYFSEVILKLE